MVLLSYHSRVLFSVPAVTYVLYRNTIDYLTQVNMGLKQKVNDEKSIQKRVEVLELKKENERLRRFVESIPQEIRQAFQERQREQSAKAPQR